MEISNHGANQGSWYVNPNTRTLTSNRKNTKIKDRDNFGCMKHLLNPVEDMAKALWTPIKLADRTTVNRALGTVTIAEGTQIAVNDGYILTVRKRGVECRRADEYAPYDQKAYEKAQGLADSLAVLLRNAGGTQKTAAFSREGYEKWTDNVSTVLNYIGIDSSRSFTINGMKYSKNAAGYWESAANSSAKAAYEKAQADNRTFTYADQRTHDQIDYISHYYLDGTTGEMQAAWQKALRETGVNPFPEGFSSTLSQLAMEQDFATGGNDDIFGGDKEGNIAAVEKILDRIDHPLGEVSERDQSFRADERVFYKAVLAYLTAPEDRDADSAPISGMAGADATSRISDVNDVSSGASVASGVPIASDVPAISATEQIAAAAKASDVPTNPVAERIAAAAKADARTDTAGKGRIYAAYESANYKIEPDNENKCFTIYNGQGERLGVFFYSDIKCRRDSSGKELLISENGAMWYDALVLDRELKEDLSHVMGVDSLETEPLQGYSLKTHAGTGIQYLIKDGEEGRGGKVLLQSEADHKKYEALAETYLSKYPNLIGSREEAYIWASFEIRGMAARTEHGILSIHNDSMSYNDNSDFKNNWSIRFMDDVYQKIFEWLQQSGLHREDMQKFSVWQGIFDDIGIDYERIWSKPEEEQGYLNN